MSSYSRKNKTKQKKEPCKKGKEVALRWESRVTVQSFGMKLNHSVTSIPKTLCYKKKKRQSIFTHYIMMSPTHVDFKGHKEERDGLNSCERLSLRKGKNLHHEDLAIKGLTNTQHPAKEEKGMLQRHTTPNSSWINDNFILLAPPIFFNSCFLFCFFVL